MLIVLAALLTPAFLTADADAFHSYNVAAPAADQRHYPLTGLVRGKPTSSLAAPADARISVEMRSAASNGYRFGFGMEDRPGRGPAAFGFWKAS